MKKKPVLLIWSAIGCSLLLVLAIGLFMGQKPQQAEASHAETVARALIADRPIDLVASDPDRQTVTLRHKTTGEERTLTLPQLEQGAIPWSTPVPPERATADRRAAATRPAAFDSAVGVPQWIPAYPDTQPVGISNNSGMDSESGTLQMTTFDPPEEVNTWYRRKLEDQGYALEPSHSRQTQAGTMVSLSATHGQLRQEVRLMIVRGTTDEVRIHINYSKTF